MTAKTTPRRQPVKGRNREFRTPRTTFIDFKQIEMDRVLTMLFPRLKFEGHASRKPPRAENLQPDEFSEDILESSEMRPFFAGFERHPDIVRKWVETELLDVVNRGKANQAVASPRPLHGETYKFRNARHCRDYGAAEQVYWMLYHARKGRGQTARDALKKFFFPGKDLLTDAYRADTVVDVETQALLRFDAQVTADMKDSREPERARPVCAGQADLLADDVLRLLAYEDHVPRSVLVEYIKTLLAFHLGLYHLKLLHLVPELVRRRGAHERCAAGECPADPARERPFADCPGRMSLVVDLEAGDNPRMAELARQSAEGMYRRIPGFVQANFVVKKLEEMAGYLQTAGIIDPPGKDGRSAGELAAFLREEWDGERVPYFKQRLASLIEETGAGPEDVDPEIRDVMRMGLDEFEAFIEILMAYRGKFHRQYITECLDSLLRKNKENGLLAQSRTQAGPRRFVLGSHLLEVLLQLAVLERGDGRLYTRELRIEDLLTFLRERYGLFIDRLPEDRDANRSLLDRRALRLNLEAFKRRLREIGFFQDLSDAYVTQKVSPRYSIDRETPNP